VTSQDAASQPVPEPKPKPTVLKLRRLERLETTVPSGQGNS
jgi:hypothetical protein